MKKILFFSVSAAILVATACMAGGSDSASHSQTNNAANTDLATENSGNTAKETREVGDFSKLQIGVNVTVRLVQGAENKVVVEGSPSLQKRIICKNEGGNLSVTEESSYKMRSSGDEKAAVTVYFKNITELKAENNGYMEGAINQPNTLTLDIASNGATRLDLTAAQVNANLACNGAVIFKGTAANAKIENNSNGSFNAEAFKTVSLYLKNESNGNTLVFASSKLEIHSESNGDLTYFGNPATKNIVNDGNGSISAK